MEGSVRREHVSDVLDLSQHSCPPVQRTQRWSRGILSKETDKLSEELSSGPFGGCGEAFRRGKKPIQRHCKAMTSRSPPFGTLTNKQGLAVIRNTHGNTKEEHT